MNIACYLIKDDGKLTDALLPQDLLVELAKSLRKNGRETVVFKSHTIEVDGLIIPAKGAKHRIMVLPNIENC